MKNWHKYVSLRAWDTIARGVGPVFLVWIIVALCYVVPLAQSGAIDELNSQFIRTALFVAIPAAVILIVGWIAERAVQLHLRAFEDAIFRSARQYMRALRRKELVDYVHHPVTKNCRMVYPE